ncbi:MAG: hypothetical protein KAZ87_06505 [Spirochaetes bacterium]|nr:hypothetical protein [Spirochaetota bacterium]
MDFIKVFRPKNSKKKIIALLLSVILLFIFIFVYSFYGMNVSLTGMLIFVFLCTIPVLVFIIIKIRLNRVIIYSDRLEVTQGMSSLVICFDEVKSVILRQCKLESPVGPTILSVQMMVFVTNNGDSNFMFKEYSISAIKELLRSLSVRNSNAIISDDVKNYLKDEERNMLKAGK